jgi:hypothetical protein
MHAFTHGENGSPGVGVMVILLVPVALLGALRAQRAVRETVRL